MQGETWAELTGYDSAYEVSASGRIRKKEARIAGRDYHDYELVQSATDSGFKYVSLMREGRPAMVYIHRIVAEAFIPNPEQLRYVEHIDGNRSNNHADNLQRTNKKPRRAGVTTPAR